MNNKPKKKKRKKQKNIRREIAVRNYIDPESNTFLKKTKSLMEAGYSNKYARNFGGQILAEVNYTDILPDSVENPQEFAKRCYNVLLKLTKELEDAPKLTEVSAKYIAEIRRTLELLAKMFGMMKPEVKEERIIKIEIPKEIVEAEYKRRKGIKER